MEYEPYAAVNDFEKVFGDAHGIERKDVERFLHQASRHVDSLTYNRIVDRGFSSLTAFQQEIIKEVCCLQAKFEYENAEMIESVLSGYSINGVSAQFGNSWNVFMDKGVAMRRDVYSILCQTGLCCQLL